MAWLVPVLALGIVGAGWGIASDRIAVRWPEHEDGEGGRRPGWRTVVAAVVGAVAFAMLADRAAALGWPLPFAGLMLAWFVSLVLLLATDLDQRLLPDLLTLPWIAVAAGVALLGANPLLEDGLLPAALVAIGLPGALLLLSIPFGPGAIGLGDLKLLVSVGLLSGASRTLAGIAGGLLLSAAVIVVLILIRRITLRTYIPFGPFLIVGAMWAILLPR